MNPSCARCKKTVYPVEKLNCLDKIWHKSCFSCEICGIKLCMTTYKGYNKLPYCNTHYPSTRFTQVSDTPEYRKLAQQQKSQSVIQYSKVLLCLLKVQQEQSGTENPYSKVYAVRLLIHLSFSGSTAAATTRPPQPTQVKLHLHDLRSSPHTAVKIITTCDKPPAPAPTVARTVLSTEKYIALYDYNAADDDEVSFNEGDIVTEATIIDDGWMEGRVVRTGEYGMLPTNYVNKV
uniref:LIM zinc-binding domain-containing protein n=1 Tax=Ciona savignyi TaxID=51511 RepID=H2ZJQ5_CIOSA